MSNECQVCILVWSDYFIRFHLQIYRFQARRSLFSHPFAVMKMMEARSLCPGGDNENEGSTKVSVLGTWSSRPRQLSRARRPKTTEKSLSTLNSHLFYRNNSNQTNSVISFISLFEKNLKTDKVGKFVKIRLRFAKSTLSISYSLKFDRLFHDFLFVMA